MRRRDPADAAHGSTLGAGAEQSSDRLLQHAPARRHDREEIEPHRAIRDPLEIVRELLTHRRLVTAPHLGEAGQARSYDEPLPVRRQLVRQLLEEDRPDRPWPDEAHVPAEDVHELGNLVELRRLEPAADPRELPLRTADELLAEVGAEPRLGAALQRPELVHREDVRAPADAFAAIEDRPPACDEHEYGDGDGDRQREGREQRPDDDVERTQDDVARPRRRLERELAVAADERVLDPRRVRHAPDRKAAGPSAASRGGYKVSLWTRSSSRPSARSSSVGASPRRRTSSG